MLRTSAPLAASLMLLVWQSNLSADAAEHGVDVAVATPTVSTFRAQYPGLQAELERHRAWAREGGWPKVPDGPTIRPDAADPRLAALAGRLAVSGDLEADAASVSTSRYNETLQEAVRRFQFRHGLEVDALVGRATLRALNVSIERRIDQIRVNLERAKRLSDFQSGDLLLVNAAAFKAYVIRDGEIVWSTKVIVGEAEGATPELRSELQHVVFNPTWSVPHSIASEEFLPDIQQDLGFFVKGGYELYDLDGQRVNPNSVDWSRVSVRNFPFRLVQQPGPRNQLGQVKFVFPNNYSVCMHDTPGKSLFAKTSRALSHGCVRVDEPLALAELILSGEGWTNQRIHAQIESGKTKTVVLPQPWPIYLFYWTAEVDDSGRIYFYEDIYARDEKVLRALDAAIRSDQYDQPDDRD